MPKFFSHRLTSQTSQKYNRSIVILRRTLLWIFGKWVANAHESKSKNPIISNVDLFIINKRLAVLVVKNSLNVASFWIYLWYVKLMLKKGYIICFQILNLARTQILITSSSYLQKFFNKCSSDTLLNYKHILQNSS